MFNRRGILRCAGSIRRRLKRIRGRKGSSMLGGGGEGRALIGLLGRMPPGTEEAFGSGARAGSSNDKRGGAELNTREWEQDNADGMGGGARQPEPAAAPVIMNPDMDSDDEEFEKLQKWGKAAKKEFKVKAEKLSEVVAKNRDLLPEAHEHILVISMFITLHADFNLESMLC